MGKRKTTKYTPLRDAPRRAAETYYVECHAPREAFEPDLNEAMQREFRENGPIPCEGGGAMGEWCRRCRFGTIEVDVEYDDDDGPETD